MYDMLNNHRIIQILTSTVGSTSPANAPNNAGIDLWENNQLPNRLLMVVDVSAIGTGGSLDLIVQDSADGTTWDADFITVPTIDETGLYLIEVDDPERYVRLNHDCTTDVATFSAYFITFEDQRRPVTQDGEVLVGTYGTGRKPKVATA